MKILRSLTIVVLAAAALMSALPPTWADSGAPFEESWDVAVPGDMNQWSGWTMYWSGGGGDCENPVNDPEVYAACTSFAWELHGQDCAVFVSGCSMVIKAPEQSWVHDFDTQLKHALAIPVMDSVTLSFFYRAGEPGSSDTYVRVDLANEGTGACGEFNILPTYGDDSKSVKIYYDRNFPAVHSETVAGTLPSFDTWYKFNLRFDWRPGVDTETLRVETLTGDLVFESSIPAPYCGYRLLEVNQPGTTVSGITFRSYNAAYNTNREWYFDQVELRAS